MHGIGLGNQQDTKFLLVMLLKVLWGIYFSCKVRMSCPVQQPGSYWDRSLAFSNLLYI